MILEYACKHCGYILLLDMMVVKGCNIQCPSCNTKFKGVLVSNSGEKKLKEIKNEHNN